ncbi:MAG: hypothetical protein OXG44_08925, partial [Gammaproteobacteria bacterium]|nr:hypothetical protein [Gammaproteobacteria bacterium]
EAFCVRCGSGLEICHAESAAWRNHIERKGLASEGVIRPPATERAPVLDMPRVTNDNALRVSRGKHALIVAAALEDYAVQCEDTSAEAAAAEWRDRAHRDGILPTIQDDMLSG